jgi:hypothetical protein
MGPIELMSGTVFVLTSHLGSMLWYLQVPTFW